MACAELRTAQVLERVLDDWAESNLALRLKPDAGTSVDTGPGA